MKQVEFMENYVSVNLHLAKQSMNKNDFKMAMCRMQNARRALNALSVLMIPVNHRIDYDNDKPVI